MTSSLTKIQVSILHENQPNSVQIASTGNTGYSNYLDCCGDELINEGVLTRGTMIRMQQPIRTSDKMQSPSFGRNEPEVKLKFENIFENFCKT